MKLIPSLASADVLDLKGSIESLGDWPYLHLDIEDGNFINNITFGLKVVKKVADECKDKEIDVHLEVLNPMEYLSELNEIGITRVSTQVEALENPQLFVKKCRTLGITPGFAVLSDTDVGSLKEVLNSADYLIFITVDADDKLQRFSEKAFEKVVKILDSKDLTPEIYADGGLGKEQLIELYKHGASGAVLGRLVFSEGSAGENLDKLKTLWEIDYEFCKNA